MLVDSSLDAEVGDEVPKCRKNKQKRSISVTIIFKVASYKMAIKYMQSCCPLICVHTCTY